MIKLERLNRNEAVRYLGGSGIQLNYRMDRLMDECERLVLSKAEPRFRFIEIDLPCKDIILGKDIVKHLDGCEKAILMCATLGAEIDKLIRINQISDMARAVVLDSFSSVAIEQVCNKIDEIIAEQYSDMNMTFRFSPGYGDYPIELQQTFLKLLDSQRRIGLTTNESFLLIPSKSVTAIIGLSKSPVEKKKRGCAICSLKGKCQYRRNGSHCEF